MYIYLFILFECPLRLLKVMRAVIIRIDFNEIGKENLKI